MKILPVVMAGLMTLMVVGACDRVSNDPEVLVAEARQALQQHEVVSGMIALRRALENDPEHVAGRLLMAEYFLEMNQAENADIQLQRVAFDARGDDYYRHKARALAWLERYDDVLALPPHEFSDPAAAMVFHRHRVDAQIAGGQLSAAHDLIEAQRGRGAGEDWLCVRHASLELAKGELDNARKRLLACEAVAAHDSDYWIQRASVEQFLRLFAYALDSLQKAAAIEQRPNHLTRNRVHAGMSQAILHIRFDNLHSAREELRRIGSTTLPVMWHYVNALQAFRAGDHDLANRELMELFRINPEYYLGLVLMQRVKYELGQRNQAREFVTRVVTAEFGFTGQDYTRHDLQMALARAFLSHRDLDQALRELTQLGDGSIDTLLLREQIRAAQAGVPMGAGELRAIERAHRDYTDQKKVLRAYLSANHHDDAERLFRELLKSPRLDEDLIDLRARYLVQQDRLTDAERFISAHIARYPRSLTRHRVEVIGLTRGIDAAIDYLRRDAPTTREYQLLLADLQIRNGEFAQALAVLQRLEREDRANTQLAARTAELALRTGDHGLAVEKYGLLVDSAAQDAQLLVNLARAQQLADDHVGARRNLELALLLQEDNTAALRFLLETELARNGSRPMELLERYGARLRDPVDMVVLRGWLHERQGQAQEARQVYEAALRDDPLNRKLLPRLVALRQQGEDVAEINRWLRQLGSSTGDDYPLLLLADLHTRERDYAQANAVYVELLARQQDNPVALNNVAWSYYQLGDLDQALTYSQQAIEALPANPAIMDTRGWLLVQSGEVQQGLGYLRKAQWGMPTSRTIAWHLAAALVRDGQRSEGRQRLERLLKDPEPFAERDDAEALLREVTGRV